MRMRLAALSAFFFLMLIPGLPVFGQAADSRVLMAVPAPTGATASEARVALVIGNSAYLTGPLKNPANDAADMAAKLRRLGFDVVERSNLRTAQIGRTLREFRSKLVPGAVALVFYAGHGLQVRGENYLPTVDAEIEGEDDVFNQSLGLRQLMELLDESKTRLNLVFLDACRNNPFIKRYRSAGDGLARVMAPSGTLISYATRPGSVASDGAGRNGLYTAHLLQVMDVPNQPIEQSLKRVVTGVKTASRGQQEPWMEGSIEGDFYFLQRAEPVVARQESPQRQQEAIDRAVEEATRRASEQAARERDEALRRASEQAARERAALQASMEQMIRQALAEQSARLEAERRAAAAQAVSQSQSAAPRPSAPAATRPLQAPAPSPASPLPANARPPEKPATLAMVSPSPGAAAGASPPTAPSVGEEARYRSTSFGKTQTLMVFTPEGSKTRHDLRWGNTSQDFDASQSIVIGAPNEGAIFFAPRWSGEFREIAQAVDGGTGLCGTKGVCRVTAKPSGNERLKVPAGEFDTIRMEGWLIVRGDSNYTSGSGTVTAWYSKTDQRLLKQTVNFSNPRGSVVLKETIELEGIGKAAAPVAGMPSDIAGELARHGSASGNFRYDNAHAGDEWEYSATDNLFGKKRNLVWRVLAVADGKGVLEEFLLDGKRIGQWVADGSANLVGIASDMGPLFMPHWQNADLEHIGIANWATASVLRTSSRGAEKGQEKITVPAGTFDTVRIEIDLNFVEGYQNRTIPGRITVWYSPTLRRVIRQVGGATGFTGRADFYRFNDSFELTAVRQVPR